MPGWAWGILGVAIAGLVGLIALAARSLVKSYVDQRVRAKFENEIESVKSDLRLKESKIVALQTNVLSGRAGRQALLDTKRIEAAENLWNATIAYDRFTMAVQSFSIIKVDDVGKMATNNAELRDLIDAMTGTRGEDLKAVIPAPDHERFRPYIPDEVWKVFDVYRGIMVFCLMRLKAISFGLEDSEKLFNNKGIVNSIKEVMPHMSEYLDKYDIVGVGHLMGPLRALVLKSIRSVIFDDQTDIENLVASGGILNALSQIDAEVARQVTSAK